MSNKKNGIKQKLYAGNLQWRHFWFLNSFPVGRNQILRLWRDDFGGHVIWQDVKNKQSLW